MAEGRVLAIVGPTAAGKSGLALRLAAELDGEIVSADSRQVYRYMDIGTGKPTLEERAAIPHHLVDVVDPNEEYGLALFLRQARALIPEIHSRSKVPILAGGTGQYIWGLLEGWNVPEVPPDQEFRRALEERARAQGAAALHRELAGLDPTAASRIEPGNPRRLIRALEVYRSSPDLFSRSPRTPPPFDTVVLGLTLERAALYHRINQRVDAMMGAGWLAEVQGLLGRGYSTELPSLSGVGYRELARHLALETPLEAAVDKTKQRTRRFALQQYGWFRLGDERIRWFEGTSAGLDFAEAYARERVGR